MIDSKRKEGRKIIHRCAYNDGIVIIVVVIYESFDFDYSSLFFLRSFFEFTYFERFYYVVVHRGSSVKFDLYGDDTRYPSRCVQKRIRGDIRPNVSFSNSIPIRTNRGN